MLPCTKSVPFMSTREHGGVRCYCGFLGPQPCLCKGQGGLHGKSSYLFFSMLGLGIPETKGREVLLHALFCVMRSLCPPPSGGGYCCFGYAIPGVWGYCRTQAGVSQEWGGGIRLQDPSKE